jgi:large subunit ribosomal protein L3
MPGRMGGKNVTVQRIEVVKVLEDKNLLLLKGSIPGHVNGIVYIKETVKPKR